MTYLQEQTVFSTLQNDELASLETELAYFYGAPNPEEIASHYLQALAALEALGINAPQEQLEQAMIPALEKAYGVVCDQTPLNFDPHQAAKEECALILAQTRKESFETLCSLIHNIYQTVFHTTSPKVEKAAWLRTFLYQYKVELVNAKTPLTQEDRDVLITLARESERLLNSLEPS